MIRPDLRGFDDLYDAYGHRVYRLCRRLCRSREDAEDLVQDVFISAFRGVERFGGRSSMIAWLFSIAVRRSHRLKEESGLQTAPLEEALEVPAADADTPAAQLDRLWLEAGLSSIHHDDREALILVKAEGLTYAEAAEILDVPLRTVQSRVRRGSESMRALLADPSPEPHGRPHLTFCAPPLRHVLDEV